MSLSVATKAATVTLLAIAATMAIGYVVRVIAGQPVTMLNLMNWIMIPAMVAGPMSYVTFRQSDRLQRAHTQLSETHQQLSEAHRDLAYRASHDSLTGLWNREAFMARLDEMEIQPWGYALLIFDADHFKRINDKFGHAEGDHVLMLIAQALRGGEYKPDLVARIGGEEFAAILTDVSGPGIEPAAEQLRRAVESIPWMTIDGQKIHVTVSIGGAMGRSGLNSRDVLKEADRQLYNAKRLGRNRVSVEAIAVEELLTHVA